MPRGRPFQQGQSGNPGGPPAGVAEAARRAMQALADAATDEKLREMSERIMDGAAAGNPVMITIVYDRLVGRARQAIEVTQEPMLRTPENRAAAAGKLSERLKRILCPAKN